MMHILLQGDALTVLRTLPDQHFHTCVTSPPYFNLRDYRVAGQIGLEATPEAYVARLVEVFREVKRVLRDDGTFWLNIGDSFNNRKKLRRSSHRPGFHTHSDDEPWVDRAAKGGCRMSIDDGVLKEKDLIGIPWRLAFALQADGWYIRSDIIWHKSNCMPESIKDRPTNAYEHVFLLAKSSRYFYDGDAIREPYAESSWSRYDYVHRGPVVDKHQPGVRSRLTKRDKWGINPLGRASRNVWKLATKSFKGAHFAVMPVELAERCIKAGSSLHGCCGICGAPWRRVTPSWQPTCQCEASVVPCRVLDPFGGAGTTSYAAIKHGRDATLIELNSVYVEIARNRLIIVP